MDTSLIEDLKLPLIKSFLKETGSDLYNLTEGRSTGIPKIRRAMKRNDNPAPVFETDPDKTYFLTILPLHPHFKKAQVEAQVEKTYLSNTEKQILILCKDEELPAKEIVKRLGYNSLSGNIKKALPGLIKAGLLAYTVPEKPKSSKQKYRITAKGIEILPGLEHNFVRQQPVGGQGLAD